MSRKRLQTYETDAVTVTYDPTRCIHAAECVRRLPPVFDTSVARWIRPERASVDEVMATVARCPTGALQAKRADGVIEVPAVPVTAQVTARGPVYVRGEVTIKDHTGAVVATGTRVALCRCGASQNKPFCDGSHRAAGFSDPGIPLGSSEKGA
jgi:CDGSH-type Zn-finger protein/uncharacterized Fe-S cluster protein YjdI